MRGALISHSPEETEALGESWGRAAESGWIIGLCGDLGVGKTQFANEAFRACTLLNRSFAGNRHPKDFNRKGRKKIRKARKEGHRLGRYSLRSLRVLYDLCG